jgi:hypothetical protein
MDFAKTTSETFTLCYYRIFFSPLNDFSQLNTCIWTTNPGSVHIVFYTSFRFLPQKHRRRRHSSIHRRHHPSGGQRRPFIRRPRPALSRWRRPLPPWPFLPRRPLVDPSGPCPPPPPCRAPARGGQQSVPASQPGQRLAACTYVNSGQQLPRKQRA